MIDWASNELELRVLVAQKDHERQTREGLVEYEPDIRAVAN